MASLSGRLHYILLNAEGLSVALADRGDVKGHNFASDICKQIRALEHEAQIFQISPGLPSFKEWEPTD